MTPGTWTRCSRSPAPGLTWLRPRVTCLVVASSADPRSSACSPGWPASAFTTSVLYRSTTPPATIGCTVAASSTGSRSSQRRASSLPSSSRSRHIGWGYTSPRCRPPGTTGPPGPAASGCGLGCRTISGGTGSASLTASGQLAGAGATRPRAEHLKRIASRPSRLRWRGHAARHPRGSLSRGRTCRGEGGSPVPVPARVLTIAGSDSGGGAGIQADLKTFLAHGVHGMSAVTAVTVQNSIGVQGFYELEPRAVFEQIESVATDIGVDAAKTGMLASAAIMEAVADACERFAIPKLVVDPVAVSKHGDLLLRPDALETLRSRILPLATVVTPNLGEVSQLTGVVVRGRSDMEAAARAVHALGPRWALIKGGHLPGPEAVDLLWDGNQATWLEAARIDTPHTHGTGCTLSSAIAATFPLGKGIGPTDHAWRFRAAGLLRPGGPSRPAPSGWPYAANPYEG